MADGVPTGRTYNPNPTGQTHEQHVRDLESRGAHDRTTRILRERYPQDSVLLPPHGRHPRQPGEDLGYG